jgi:GT2 family glycosyltransferase
MARNELFNLAYTQQYDMMVFIDDDEYWDPKILIEILKSPKDVIAVPVVNKGDKNIQYNVFLSENSKIDHKDGYVTVQQTGTGFLKLSRKVLSDLWESNPDIVFRAKKLKNICEFTVRNDAFIGEDITLSRKIKELGYEIWINPKHTVAHLGVKMYKGNFEKDYNEKYSILQSVA